MAAQGYARSELRTEVARTFGYKASTATDAGNVGGTTLVDSTLNLYADDYFINWRLFIDYTGPAPDLIPYDADALVTDFTGSTGTLTFAPPHTRIFTGVGAIATGQGEPYELYRYFNPADLNHALGYVCKGTTAIDTLTPSATTTDYDLSSLTTLHYPAQIRAVLLRPADDHTLPPQQIRGWTVRDDNGVLTLTLPATLAATDDLSIVYANDGDPFSTDATTVNLPMPLVRARTVVYLIENLLSGQDGQGLQRWGTMLREWRGTLLQEERKFMRPADRAKRFCWQVASEQDPLLSAFGLVERYR